MKQTGMMTNEAEHKMVLQTKQRDPKKFVRNIFGGSADLQMLQYGLFAEVDGPDSDEPALCLDAAKVSVLRCLDNGGNLVGCALLHPFGKKSCCTSPVLVGECQREVAFLARVLVQLHRRLLDAVLALHCLDGRVHYVSFRCHAKSVLKLKISVKSNHIII